METRTIDLSLQSQSFARLLSVQQKGDAKYIDIPTSALPEGMRQDLEMFYFSFLSDASDVKLPDVMLRLAFDSNGSASKLFGPAVYAHESGGLLIKWGKEELLGELNKDSTAVFGTAEPGELAICKIGKYEELCYSFTFTDDNDDLVVLNLPIKLVDYKQKVTIAQAKAICKKDKDKLWAMLRQLNSSGESGSSGSGNNEPVYGIGDLAGQTGIKVTKAKPVNVKHGPSFILTIEGKQYWSHKHLNALLFSGAKAETLVFDYRTEEYKNGKDETKIRHIFENIQCEYDESAEFVDLSFLA